MKFTLTFKLYPAINLIIVLFYAWFLGSALSNKAYGAALIVSSFWGWLILAVPLLFLIIDHICEGRAVRLWGYFAGILWTLIWFGAVLLNGIMVMGIPWLSGGREDLALFSWVFLAASLFNLIVFIYNLFFRKYSVRIVKS